MFLLFQKLAGSNYWMFTGTFNFATEAFNYAKEYFGQGTEFHICEQNKVKLDPSSIYHN